MTKSIEIRKVNQLKTKPFKTSSQEIKIIFLFIYNKHSRKRLLEAAGSLKNYFVQARKNRNDGWRNLWVLQRNYGGSNHIYHICQHKANSFNSQ